MQIDWWTLGLQAVNFAVLVWLLRRFLYAPVRRVIAERKAEVDAARAEAAEAKTNAEAEAEKLRQAQAALEEDRQGVMDRVAAAAAEAARETAAEARSAAATQVAKAEAAIAAERAAAVEAAESELADLAAGLAGRILHESAAKVAPGLFLDGLAEALGNLPEAERARLAADMGKPGAVATVVTARPLPPQDHGIWSSRLVPLLGGAGTLAFAEDRAILGGAELRLAHSVLKFGWADRIAAAREVMAGDGTD
jgi:F0F1-type ATP synthase membrane subunit b/b'